MVNFSGVEGRADQPEIDHELHDVAQVVHEEFDQHLDPGAVDECLQKVVSRFEGAKIRSFIPLLVGRYVREELRTLLRQSSKLPETP
jgi:hypothetical protein